MTIRRVLLLATVMLAIFSQNAFSQLNSLKIAKAQAYLSVDKLKPGDSFKMAVVVDIKQGFHINSATTKEGIPSKLTIKPPKGITFSSPDYPKPVMLSLKFAGNKKIPVYQRKLTIFVDGKVDKNAKAGSVKIPGTFSYQACNDNQCFAPAEVSISVSSKIVSKNASVKAVHPEIFGTTTANLVVSPGAKNVGSMFDKGLLVGFLSIFALGLLLSFTPCVYPMIPVTIGYFGMQAGQKTKRVMFLAGLYVFGLAVTYSTLGVIAAMSGKMLGSALQNPIVPIGIAVVLVGLALSMFGLYEFRVPSFISANSQGKTGAVGALFMGLLFGIVAAPCVGPVTMGLLLYVAKVGKPIFGFLAFFALALGLGLPFFFLATFSGSIGKLPQAGMWMESVKKIFGLMLIGAAIYYLMPLLKSHLSTATSDMMLPTFVALSGLYIGWVEKGLRKLPKIKHARKLVGVTLVAVGIFTMQPSTSVKPMTFQPYSDDAISKAAADGKPVMIDFGAEWCQSCKELKAKTFPAASVKAEGGRFVLLEADQTEASSANVKAREKKYNVIGLPTIIFIDSSGNEVKDARISGFVTPNVLAAKMKMVH